MQHQDVHISIEEKALRDYVFNKRRGKTFFIALFVCIIIGILMWFAVYCIVESHLMALLVGSIMFLLSYFLANRFLNYKQEHLDIKIVINKMSLEEKSCIIKDYVKIHLKLIPERIKSLEEKKAKIDLAIDKAKVEMNALKNLIVSHDELTG